MVRSFGISIGEVELLSFFTVELLSDSSMLMSLVNIKEVA